MITPMTKHSTLIVCLLMVLSAPAFAGKLNISKTRYVEGLYIKAAVNEEGTGGTLDVRPEECLTCPLTQYAFDSTATILYGNSVRTIEALADWSRFSGELSIDKVTEQPVTIRRIR